MSWQDDPGGFAARLADEARDHHKRWNDEAWRQLTQGPAQDLTHGLRQAGVEPGSISSTLNGYLTLARDAIGLGVLMPVGAQVDTFFSCAWMSLIPRLLPSLPPAEHATALSTLWTLAENLQSGPAWLRAIFVTLSNELTDLHNLEAWVCDTTLAAMEPPEFEIALPLEAVWVDLAEADPAFLPGTLRFVSPTVIQVGDRHRTDALGRPLGLGVWLDEVRGPRIIGRLRWDEGEEEDTLDPEPERFFNPLQAQDERFDTPYRLAANAWRAAATLMTSQFLVALMPG